MTRTAEPDSFARQRAAAVQWLHTNKPQRALEVLEQADPDDVRTWRLRVEAFAALDQRDRTALAAREGLRLAPDDVYLLRMLGHVQMDRRLFAEAEDAFQAALRESPENADVLIDLIQLRTEEGRMAAARDLFAAARRVTAPDDLRLLFTQYNYEVACGQVDAAKAVLETVLRIDPENAEAKALIAEIGLRRQESPATWTRHARSAAAADPTNHWFVSLGRSARLADHPLMAPLRVVARVTPSDEIATAALLFAISLAVVLLAGYTFLFAMWGLLIVFVIYCLLAGTYLERRHERRRP